MKSKSNSKIQRIFVVRCRTNRGGKHMIPECIKETVPSKDPLLDYDIVRESRHFGDIRSQLIARGDLIETKSGDRISRNPHIGKEIRPSRNGYTFVVFTCMVPEYKCLTRRTANPKLGWLMQQCKNAGLRVFIQGKRMLGDPISWVHRDDLYKAWDILDPVDDIPDDDIRFSR